METYDHKQWQCQRPWNSVEAKFEPCALQLIPWVAVASAISVAIWHLIYPYTSKLSPRWTRAFVPQDFGADTDLGIRSDGHQHWRLISLIMSSIVGLTAQGARAVVHFPDYTAAGLALAWLILSAILTFSKPRTVVTSLLCLQFVFFACYVALLDVQRWEDRTLESAVDILCLMSLLAMFSTLLTMTWRDPRLPAYDIGSASGTPSSALRSPEDNITLAQFLTVSWVGNLLKTGTKRSLEEKDVWSLPYQFQHAHLHRRFSMLHGSVLRRLLVANGWDCLLSIVIGTVQLLLNFAGPVLLQQLLLSIENPSTPLRAAITYAILSFAARLASGQLDVLDLWFSRRAYERSRGEMITMLYQKTLSRKSRSAVVLASTEDDQPPEMVAEDVLSIPGRITKLVTQLLDVFNCSGQSKARRSQDRSAEPGASMGKILNLMRNDAYEVAQRFWEVKNIVTIPLSLAISIALIWQLLGWSCLIGVAAVGVAQALNAIVAKILVRWERQRRLSTDARLQISAQVVESIRHLRHYGWQQTWIARILEKRQHELNLRLVTAFWNVLIGFNSTLANGVFPVLSFYAYTVLARQPLRIDVAFPALQLFSMLETSLRSLPGLVTVLINANVAITRIEDFMCEPDKYEDSKKLPETNEIRLKDASYAWPGSSSAVLRGLTLTFPKGLTIVHGRVAGGKTALLNALLGELDLIDGHASATGDMIAYCSQTPWLESMSIRDNILFASPFDAPRYRHVVDACALTSDLASFQDGDLSNIGEQGIGLSGGQKARVALARALYSRAQVLLLDDPVSALDHETAQHVLQQGLNGPLTSGRIVVLVTHRVDIAEGVACQTVEIQDGVAAASQTSDRPISVAALPTAQGARSTPNQETQVTSEMDDPLAELQHTPRKFEDEEQRQRGGVQARVYWEYIKAGRYRWWILLIMILAIFRFVDIGKSWLLKQWGEAYQQAVPTTAGSPFEQLPNPEHDVRPWLYWFLIIALAQAVMFFASRVVMVVIVYFAGQKMFQQIINRICYATFRFYDVTPVGRLLNRLTGDIGTVDGAISEQLSQIIFLSIAWVGSVLVIASITPTFFIFALLMALAFALVFGRFLPTSQSLRRLEMISLSPLMTNFGALLQGLVTVRAFGAQTRFQNRNIAVTDAFQRQDHIFWSVQAWLTYRFEVLAAISTFLLTMLAIYTNVSPGLVAFVLTAAATFVSATTALCRQYGQLQMDFVSVERVVELLHLDQEPAGTIDPPASWPSLRGDIVLKDVTLRYASHLEPAIKDVSLTIKGGSSTAIVGRTGSGKSTLVTALLASVAPEAGHILIDGVDINQVKKQVLRQRITFLAQDPLLFQGTMRENLDPTEEFDAYACQKVLDKVCGRHGWTISTHIENGGQGFSQGQRQLVGLARCVLRRSPIVILDEATASIDLETAKEMHTILREEMKESTVITIAHRADAVKHADTFVTLDNGRLVEGSSANSTLIPVKREL